MKRVTFPSEGETQSNEEGVNKLLAHTVKRMSHFLDSTRPILSDEYGLYLMCQWFFLLGRGEDPHLVPQVVQLDDHCAAPVRLWRTEGPVGTVNFNETPFGATDCRPSAFSLRL